MNAFTAASEFDRPKPRAFTLAPRAGSDRLFRAAVRHSRYVRLLRVAIPAGVVVAVVGGIAVTALLKPLRLLSKLPVDLGSLVVSGSKIMMQQPRLARTYTDKHGLKDLVREILGIDVSKQQQLSDWGAATLSDAQVAYAASDVLHLHALKEKLDAMLVREGRAELAAACFRFLPDRARLDLAGWAGEDIFAHS